MKKFTIRDIADNAIIAALYAVLTISLGQFAYREIQFRIAEILLFLCFFRKKYIFGVTIGCLIANFFSTDLGLPDMIFGTAATLVSALLIAYSKRIYIAWLFPIIINAPVVGLELHFILGLPFWVSAGTVALGEAAVMLVGLGIFLILRRRPTFLKLIRAEQNIPYNE
ncbi:MAG: QueT transporter family protein [Bacilli bacterium]